MLTVAFASALPVAAVPAIEIIDLLFALPMPPSPLPPQPANEVVKAISSLAPAGRMMRCSRVLNEVRHRIVRELDDWGGVYSTFDQTLTQRRHG